jgi:hypothetical protein
MHSVPHLANGTFHAGWGGDEAGVIGRQTGDKALIVVAAEEEGKGIGYIRLHTIPDASSASLHGFIRQAVAPGSTIRSDGWSGYFGLDGYFHDRQVQSHRGDKEHVLPRAFAVVLMNAHVKLLRQLRKRIFFLDSGQGHLRFEGRCIVAARTSAHLLFSSQPF